MNVPRIAGLLALAAASALAGGCASDARIQADAKAMTLNAELISRQQEAARVPLVDLEVPLGEAGLAAGLPGGVLKLKIANPNAGFAQAPQVRMPDDPGMRVLERLVEVGAAVGGLAVNGHYNNNLVQSTGAVIGGALTSAFNAMPEALSPVLVPTQVVTDHEMVQVPTQVLQPVVVQPQVVTPPPAHVVYPPPAQVVAPVIVP